MKPRKKRRIYVVLAIIVILVVLVSYGSLPDKTRMNMFIDRNKQALANIIHDEYTQFIEKDSVPSKEYASLFFLSGLHYIDTRYKQEGHIYFKFKWGSNIGEESMHLVYTTDEYFLVDLSLVTEQQWDSAKQADGMYRLDGMGCSGEGFILLERIQDNWYCYHTYLPT